MKVNYRFKKEMKSRVKKEIKFKELAELVGVNPCYISSIVNGKKKNVSKMLAYCIAKAVSPNCEISDLFDIVVEK